LLLRACTSFGMCGICFLGKILKKMQRMARPCDFGHIFWL
jgi:hypothetical protein